MSRGGLWYLYVFHFHERWKHAQHYTGITNDPVRREKEHAKGQGSPLIKKVVEAGIKYEFILIDKFKGYSAAKEAERRKKNAGGAKKWCPHCKSERRSISVRSK